MKKYRIKLWELLAERKLTITQVSKDTGISRTTLTGIYYHKGKGIQLSTMNKLCNYLRVTPGELFEEVKPIKPVYPTKKEAIKTTAT